MSHYKTNDPRVLSTYAAINEEYSALQKAAAAFAKTYGAKKWRFSNCITSISFGGLIFAAPQESRFWTKPDRHDGTQRPRQSVPGLSAEEKKQHKALLEAWNREFPTKKVDTTPLYEAWGSNWGSCLLSGMGYFEGADGYIYVSTGAKLGDHMQSIPEWEYIKAKCERPAANGGAA